MATTPRDVMLAAYGRSTKNSGRVIADEETELFRVVVRTVQLCFALGAEINETFFAGMEVIVESSGWARPTSAENIFRIEDESGEEVVTVPFDDREAEIGRPAVYEFGQVFQGAGNALDPTTDDLTMFFSRIPTDPADLDAALDGQWPDHHLDLLASELALYLAVKDGRSDEYAGATAERDRRLALFIAFLEHATTNTVRRFRRVNVVNTSRITRLFTQAPA